MNKDIQAYNDSQLSDDKEICDILSKEIARSLPDAESKIWHAHPVWFLDGNPIVGYSKVKDCIRLLFWSGADFGEEGLKPGTGKFKDASARYRNASQVNRKDLKRWLEKSRSIQWDYKNVVKRKGVLERIKHKAESIKHKAKSQEPRAKSQLGSRFFVRDYSIIFINHYHNQQP